MRIKTFSDDEKKVREDPRKDIENDPNMSALEDYSIFDLSSDDQDNGAKADMNNLDTTIQMDVKSDFLYGWIEEEVYVCQPPGFEDLDFLVNLFVGQWVSERKYRQNFVYQKGLKVISDSFKCMYENDIIFGLTNKKLCIAFEKLMHEKFQMSSMGELTFFLGLQV
ncbi:hypothetical protein Tco_0214600 [Tanacetum coccineum]